MREDQLIFIVSQPRSGSTYLQNILSNNMYVSTVSEPWVLLNFANHFNPNLIESKFDSHTAKEAFDDYLTKYSDLNYKKELKTLLLKIYNPMLSEGERYVIDKTPRYWEIVNEIVEFFPKSKIIILKRNPISVLNSMIRTWEIEDLDELSYLKRDILYAPEVLQKFCIKNRGNNNVYILKYEELIANKQSEIRKIYNWLGLEFKFEYLKTKSNEKFKGRFGDPYQNNKSKKDCQEIIFKENLEEFVNGYVNFLSNDFLSEYGGYETHYYNKESVTFKEFLNMDYNKSTINEIELLRIKTSFAYKLGKILLTPFRFLRQAIN